ncbi:MAG: competence/damage-inducible protein A [Anaerolineales bacterium]
MNSGPTALLLAVGDELLNGEVRDTNLFTLIRRLTRLGFRVEEALIVRDEPDRVADRIRNLLQRDPAVLLISGGLGPTEDDSTLQAIARALDRPLVESPDARALVEEQYDALLAAGQVARRGPEPARKKMATLPTGATPLLNPTGTAPGVRLEAGETLIYSLPGVPAELEAIYEESIEPELRERFGTAHHVEAEIIIECSDEAEAAALLRDVRPRHPAVYLKSLARPFPHAKQHGLRIIAATSAPEEEQAREAVQAALEDLQDTLEKADIPILDSSL